MFCSAVLATETKQLQRLVTAILQGLVIVFSPCESVLGTVYKAFFIVLIDLMPFQAFFELFRLDSKYFYSNFVYIFSKGMISFCDFCILMRFCFNRRVLFG